MYFLHFSIVLLPSLVSALPQSLGGSTSVQAGGPMESTTSVNPVVPTQTGGINATLDTINQLIAGIQDNIDAGAGEISAVQDCQTLETSSATAADISASIAGITDALNIAIDDRTDNQALAADFPDVLAGLALVQTAQEGAITTIATLTGADSNDAPILSGLVTRFQGGITTNENNLALAKALIG